MSEKRVHVWVQHFKDRPHLVLQWIDPVTNKRKSRSAETADEEAAEHKRSDLESDLNNGRFQDAGRMTWGAFRALFEQEYVAATRQNTQDSFASALDLFEKLCNPRALGGINVRTLSAFAAQMRKVKHRGGRNGYAPGTIKVYLQSLHTALAWAVQQKLLAAVPEFPKAEVLEPVPQPVPTESFEKLLSKAPDDQYRTFLLCGWLAGMRLSETFLLEWEATEKAPYLDLSRNRIIFPRTFVKAKRDQWVPLDAELRAALEALPQRGNRVFHLVGRWGPMTPFGMGRSIACLARKAGVKLTMKSLRRGFGCRYAGKVPAQVLQRLMRHSDIKITMTYYANIDDAVEEAILGPRRNRTRNKTTPAAPLSEASNDTTTCQERDLGP